MAQKLLNHIAELETDSMINRFAAIAARMYTDTVTVYRSKTTIDPAHGIATEGERVIYASLPCRLSKTSGGAPAYPETIPRSEQTYTLFTPSEVRLMANDRVEIVHMGDIYKGRAERGMVYEIGCETKISIREIVCHG